MTKAADLIVNAADAGVNAAMFRAGRHYAKIKKSMAKKIDKNADNWVKAAHITEKVVGIGGRASAGVVDIGAVVLLKIAEIFVVGADGLLRENKLLDWFQKVYANQKIKKNKYGQDKKISKFTKENPRIAAYLTWYLMLMSVIGGTGVTTHKDKIAQVVKDKIEKIKDIKSKHKDQNTIYIDKIYSVDSKSFRHDVVNENWAEIVVGLLEFETYRAKPVKQHKESRYTYGPGITWVYENGEQHACSGDYVDKVKQFSDKEIWDQVKQHCQHKTEVLGIAQKYLSREEFDTVTTQQILGLMFAGYQTPASLGEPVVSKRDVHGNVIKDKNGKPIKERIPGIIPKLKSAGSDEQKIVDAFIAGKEISPTWKDGTNKRRWWCAMYYIGKINQDDFLSMDRDAFSEIDINVIMKDGHFVFDDATIEYALGVRNTRHVNIGTVSDYIAKKPWIVNGQYDDKFIAFNVAQKDVQDKTRNLQKDNKTFVIEHDITHA